jgi:hypothetical protein
MTTLMCMWRKFIIDWSGGGMDTHDPPLPPPSPLPLFPFQPKWLMINKHQDTTGMHRGIFSWNPNENWSVSLCEERVKYTRRVSGRFLSDLVQWKRFLCDLEQWNPLVDVVNKRCPGVLQPREALIEHQDDSVNAGYSRRVCLALHQILTRCENWYCYTERVRSLGGRFGRIAVTSLPLSYLLVAYAAGRPPWDLKSA